MTFSSIFISQKIPNSFPHSNFFLVALPTHLSPFSPPTFMLSPGVHTNLLTASVTENKRVECVQWSGGRLGYRLGAYFERYRKIQRYKLREYYQSLQYNGKKSIKFISQQQGILGGCSKR